jgi:prolyl oligopeptidase
MVFFHRLHLVDSQSACRVIYRQNSISDATNEVFFDPNTLSEDGSTSLSQTSWSEDGKLMGYMLSAGGSDWRTVKVIHHITSKNIIKIE